MFEGNFVSIVQEDAPANIGPTISIFGVRPHNIGRIPGFSYRRLSWSWFQKTYEIRAGWIDETKSENFRVATATRVFFRDRPDITYTESLSDISIQRTEVFFEIFENNGWTLVWRHVFEYGELSALRVAFRVAFGETGNFPWEITLPDLSALPSL